MTRRSVWRRKPKSGRSRSRGRRKPRQDKLRLMLSKRETINDINDLVVATTEVIIKAAMLRTIVIVIDSVRTVDAETGRGKRVKPMSTTMSVGIEMVATCLRAHKSHQQELAIETSSRIEGEYKFRVTILTKIKNY